ncbi:DegT/DnrJ/EryC1/StrS family aminotransferase [Paraburkholderia sp.]|uniref:DegT/DnrJ/EryC1/StrS family aminotransferase n=1 Tax=Paraburkholderia sp. TaxID=1926495 RepID=UPI0023A2552B|nr:DegT/DnrJ/EryC1/StrS family aminotransferase [Paraburkholderia sp.]MDE1178962.1 DegT/DnrJ/EryC1/StrS family aminotransferase [Paraburkholderia sp.]
MTYKYPVYRPYFNGREKDLVMDCIESTWISSRGRYISEFETRFANWLGVRRATTVSNGTVALHVALHALGIGPGDEVLVPALTYVATANAVRYTGATVVLVDSEPNYWQMDIRDAESKITARTKAIIPVHLYGHATDMTALMALARRKSLFVIEDCAEAIGTRIEGRNVGTFGDLACFSFFANKTITTGEGGMVVSNDDRLADRVAQLKSQAVSTSREYWHDEIGFNYRMTNMCAAIGCAQMDMVDELIARKQRIADWYKEFLEGVPVHVHETQPDTFHSFWMVSILTQDAKDRDPLRDMLKEFGVETRPLFHPIHHLDMYKEAHARFPVAEDLSSRGVNLPSYPALMRGDVATICAPIRAYFERMGNVRETVSALRDAFEVKASA